MTHSDLIKKIRKRDYAALYLLHGEEAYFIDAVADVIANEVLTEDEKAFNLTILYGKDSDWKQIVDLARRYPVMAERQVIIIREAQQLKGIEELYAYAENPSTPTLLVICFKYGSPDKRKKFYKMMEKNGVVLAADPLRDYQLPDWITGQIRDNKRSIAPEAAQMLAEFVGNDLTRLSNELGKIYLNVSEGTEVRSEHIKDLVGISKEYTVFELTKALATGDIPKAAHIANRMTYGLKEQPLPMIIGALFNFFSKVYAAQTLDDLSENAVRESLRLPNVYAAREYIGALRHFNRQRTEEAISLLLEYDLRSKGFNDAGTAEAELLRELSARLL